ncbi:DUF3413 domain-containing protein [Williamwhitmania taraxaci]|nr:DUF3413 domain-containing protein [Williamwhitmania taraxaci]
MRKLLLKQGAWVFLFISLFYILIASRYFQYFSDAGNVLTIGYLTLVTISHFVMLSLLTYLLLYVPVVLLVPNRTVAWVWAALAASMGLAILFLDTFVFSLYRFHINRFTLELLFGGAGGQIFEVHLAQYFQMIGVVLLFLAIMLFTSFRLFRWQQRRPLRGFRYVVIGVVFMMVLSHFFHAWADAANYKPITKSSRYYPLFFPTTSKGLMLKMGLVDSLSESSIDVGNSEESKALNYPQNPLIADSTAKTNVVVILLDSWYYKVFNPEVMPNISAFSKRCEVYNHHYSGSNGTRTGVFSIFYSIPGIYWNDVLSSNTSSILVDMMQKNNYQIKTLTSASLISPPFHRTVFSKVKNLNLEVKGEKAVDRDMNINKEWLSGTAEMAANPDKPVFAFLFYDALHAISHPKDFKGPFQPEWDYAKYEILNNDTDPTQFLNLYKNAAYFLDSLVGEVLRDMEQKGLLKNTYVVITGDHSQEFNDNKKNYWGHNGNYSAAQMQVPLLIYKPGIVPKQHNHWTCHYDLVPSIFTDVFHCQNKISDYSMGRHLNDSSARSWIMVGSNDNFAILEPGRITSIYFDGHYDITDDRLNEIPGATINTKQVNEIMQASKVYYKK